MVASMQTILLSILTTTMEIKLTVLMVVMTVANDGTIADNSAGSEIVTRVRHNDDSCVE